MPDESKTWKAVQYDMMTTWRSVKETEPPIFVNVLFAFKEHWNAVVGFKTDANEFYETSAHDNNSKIEGAGPDWWVPIQEVPHRNG
jgi:hypothetical protein